MSHMLKGLEKRELELDVGIIRKTKIHKVLKAIGKLDPNWFPGGQDGLGADVQASARLLLEKWMERMAADLVGTHGAIQDLENVGEKRRWKPIKSGYFIAVDSQEVSPEFVRAVLQDPYYDVSQYLGGGWKGERVMETIFGKSIEVDEGGDIDGDVSKNEEKQKDKQERKFGVSVGFANSGHQFGKHHPILSMLLRYMHGNKPRQVSES